MKNAFRTSVVAGTLALGAAFAALARPDDKSGKPEMPPVRAEVRVDANGRPDFSGTWRLNEDLSDDPRTTISHKDPELVIRDLNERSRTVFTDARKVEEERSEGTAKIQTKWKDRSIVVVTKLADREITDTYERAADGARLFLTTKMEGGRASFSFRRVYEAQLTPVPAEGGAADPRSDPKPPST